MACWHLCIYTLADLSMLLLAQKKQSTKRKSKILLPLRKQSFKMQLYAKVVLIIFVCHSSAQTADDLFSSLGFEWSDLCKKCEHFQQIEASSGCSVTPCEGSHHFVNLRVCAGVFEAPALNAKGESHIQWRVLFCWCRPTSPQQSHPPLLLLLKSGLQHGNENCHPVPTLIMEFRGGRHRLNHNGIKEAWEGASRRAGGTGGAGGETERVAQAAEVQARTWRTCDSVQTRFLLRRQRKYIGGESQHLQRFYSQCSGDSGKVQEGWRFFGGSFCPAETLWSSLHWNAALRSLR